MLEKAYDHLIEGLAVVSGLIIAGVCLLIVYDVIARNLGLQPPASTVALTEYALLYFTMAASPWLVRTRGHIVVEIMHSRLSGVYRTLVDHIILIGIKPIENSLHLLRHFVLRDFSIFVRVASE